MAVIHSSYYAMFHAARAVLFLANGTAPRGHDRTIQQFGLLVKNLDQALRSAGKEFNRVKEERSGTDYDEDVVPSSQGACDASRAAIDFLDICGSRYALDHAQSTPP
jgi:uncharacterized protein (UPF0332 family)